MTTLPSLRSQYAAAFAGYLARPGEGALRSAYELGRDAVAQGVGVLELAAAHQDVLRETLGNASAPGDSERVAAAAADFFLESLSAFEMLQRGLRDAQEAAVAEQRQATMLRRLSTFLNDASLALAEAESLEEMLQLLAEQTRELLEAECCIAVAAPGGGSTTIEAVSAAEDASEWLAVADQLSPARLAAVLLGPGRPTRLAQPELADDPVATSVGGLLGRPLRALLGSPLTGIDGRPLGSVHLFDPRRARFSDVDEAELVHLTQLAAAALERVALYGRDRRIGDVLERARRPDAVEIAGFDVAVRCSGEGDEAVWFEIVDRAKDGVVALAGDVRGPAAAVGAALARAAARALASCGMPMPELVAELTALVERLTPGHEARSAAATVGGMHADVGLGPGEALVVQAGGGAPAVAVATGAVEDVCDEALARLVEHAEGEVGVLAVALRRG